MSGKTNAFLEQKQIELCHIPVFVYKDSKRPTPYDENVIRDAVLKKFREIEKYYQEKFSGPKRQSMIDKFVFVIHESVMDAYYMATGLTEETSIPEELIELCNKILTQVYDSHKEAVISWVSVVGLVPKHKVGDRVEFYRAGNPNLYSGKIISNKLDTGEYVVFCEELGHVESGAGIVGVYIPWEALDSQKILRICG